MIIHVSHAARLSYDSKGYLLNVNDDDLTIDAMVDSLLQRMLEDLETIGIRLTASISELCANWYEVRQFVDLVGMLLPADLIPTLRTDPSFARGLRGVLSGDDGLDRPIIIGYLELLGNWSHLAMARYGDLAKRLSEHVEADDSFTGYLQATYDEAIKVALADISIELVGRYLTHLSNRRNRFFSMVGRLTSTLGGEEATRLEVLFQTYVQSVITPGTIQGFAWMMDFAAQGLEDRDASEMAIYEKYRKRDAVSSPLNAAWWVATRQTPKAHDVVGMVLYQLSLKRLNTPTVADVEVALSKVLQPLAAAGVSVGDYAGVAATIAPLYEKVPQEA